MFVFLLSASANRSLDSDHITAIQGDTITFNCNVNFPDNVVAPYVVQWWRKDKDLPIYIWYDDYPEHASSEYAGRVSRVQPGGDYGHASLILSKVKAEDRGWYNCKVLFLNRTPEKTVVRYWTEDWVEEQSSSGDVTNNPPFTYKDALSQHGKVGCQNWHEISAAGGER